MPLARTASLFTQKAAALSLAALLVVTPVAPSQQSRTAVPSLPPDAKGERFVADLMKKMTLDEKLGQMEQIPYSNREAAANDNFIRKGQVGSFLNITDAALISRLQHEAVEQSRLHIPLIFGFDVIHGLRTIYPIPLAMASSWDPSLEETAQRMAAREASAIGIHWTFAPMVDIARDPRWGRIMEGAGEDPFLGQQMAAAQVRGFQGDTIGSLDHILACVKHFAGYGAADGGRDYDSSNISDEQLENIYLPPFHAAIQAGAGSLMSAYEDLNTIPATGNKWLLHDVLRERWGFNGFVVSDWDAVKSLQIHGFAASPADAAARAVTAGVDMEMTSHTYRDTLPADLKDNTVKLAAIDTAVHNILMTKYRLGLFEHPYAVAGKDKTEILSPEQHAAARLAATRTAVLLRNEGNLLPLKKSISSIAVIGPLADSQSDIMGSWSLAGHYQDSITVLQGLKNKLGSSVTINATRGVELRRGSVSIFDDQFAPEPNRIPDTDEARTKEFNHAIDLVKQSDVTVMVLGESHNMSGERASRQTLTLPGDQQRLLQAAIATGKPVALVLLNGRPLDITWASMHVPAILEAWYPGTEGGNAVADLLFGDANPGGHLTVTWPRSVGQVPTYYAQNLTQIPDDTTGRYWDGSSAPLYPFGYGLSYATFKLDNLKTDGTSLRTTGTLNVSIDVENTSAAAGDDVIQLYTHQQAGSASRPRRELKGFTRIHLNAGEKRTITIPLHANDLAFWSPATHASAVEPGNFDLWAGDNSNATAHANFTVVR